MALDVRAQERGGEVQLVEIRLREAALLPRREGHGRRARAVEEGSGNMA
jgi:hypothetical protein